MRKKRHNAGLDSSDTLVAQWETTGSDWLALYKYTSERFGTVYSYTGTGCGGGLNCNPELDPALHGPIPNDDADAIAQMERPWGGDNRPGAGQAFVMKCDRKSLARVF